MLYLYRYVHIFLHFRKDFTCINRLLYLKTIYLHIFYVLFYDKFICVCFIINLFAYFYCVLIQNIYYYNINIFQKEHDVNLNGKMMVNNGSFSSIFDFCNVESVPAQVHLRRLRAEQPATERHRGAAVPTARVARHLFCCCRWLI